VLAQGARIDLRRNDVGFVEDDWESPTLGAWGLGWKLLAQRNGVTRSPLPASRRARLQTVLGELT